MSKFNCFISRKVWYCPDCGGTYSSTSWLGNDRVCPDCKSNKIVRHNPDKIKQFTPDELFNLCYEFYKDGDMDSRNKNACLGSFRSHFIKKFSKILDKE